MSNIILYFNWIKRLIFHFFRFSSPFMWIFSIPLVLLTSYFLCSNWESRFRMGGMALQLIGISTVAWGLIDKYKLFNRETIIKNIISFFSFPKLKRNSNINAIIANSEMQTSSTLIRLTANFPKDSSLEEKVNLIKKELNQLNQLFADLDKKIDINNKQHNLEFDGERLAREEDIKKLKDLIYKATANEIHIEAIGVMWIFFGIIFSTASEELVCLFFCLPN